MKRDMAKYTWLVFDADGTLFDYDRAELNALSRTLGEYGGHFDDDVLAVFRDINSALWRRFEEGNITSERLRVQRFEELADVLDLSFSAEELSTDYLARLGTQTHLMPQAERIVGELAQGFGLALATNGIADVQRSRFGACALRPFFQQIVISDDIGVAKPAAGFFEHLFDQIGNPSRDEVLMVGDGLSSDIAGAAAFGIDSCWYNPSGRHNGATVRPTYEISELPQILTIARGPGS